MFILSRILGCAEDHRDGTASKSKTDGDRPAAEYYRPGSTETETTCGTPDAAEEPC